MARSTFGIGDLNAAAPGLSRLTAALLGGDQSYQQGFEGGVGVQSKIAQTLAQIKEQNAVAGLHDAQAAETQQKTKTMAGRPDLFNEQVANGSGVDIPTVNAYRQQLRTGVAPAVPMGPPTAEGQMGVGSFVLPDATRSKISGAIQQFLPLLSNTGDLKPDDLAKAAQLFRESGLSDDIIRGNLNRNVVSGAQAAVAGKPLFNTSADGAVLDQYGGQLDTNNPMARATIGLRGAQADEANARAGEASAKASQTRQQVADGLKTGDIVVITDNDGNTSLLNKRTGISRPATSADGVPLIGKSSSGNLKPIPANVNAKIIEGKQGLTNIDQAIASLEADPGAVGWTNGIPGAQTVKQLWASPEDTATRAQVANIGSLVLHDRSGAAVSASEFPRLAPFIPSASDSKATAVAKLKQMKQIAENELGLYSSTYNEDSGYRPSPILTKPAAQPAASGFKYLGKE